MNSQALTIVDEILAALASEEATADDDFNRIDGEIDNYKKKYGESYEGELYIDRDLAEGRADAYEHARSLVLEIAEKHGIVPTGVNDEQL